MMRPNAGARNQPADNSTPLSTASATSQRTNISTTFSRRQHNNKRSQQGSIIPFSILVVISILAMVGMGLMSIYSMLYITNGMDNKSAAPASDHRNLHHLKNLPPNQEAKQELQKIYDAFSIRYGSYASTLLEQGIQSFGSLEVTAQRMVNAAQAGRPFVMAFSGYSITVGRGNFFNQSFPFVVQNILQQPINDLLGINLIVRNGAIGGIPSFPYGFCLEHFLGTDPDVISWDYSMNEGPRDASVLEAFLRQAMQQLPRRPMLIMLDRNPLRTQLLKDYADRGLLQDAIAVGKKEIMDEKKAFGLNPLPPGFQEWDQFGAPKNCPGRGSWHPKRQEHAMIGWMIAMHFTKALERAYELLSSPSSSASSLSSRQLVVRNQPPSFSKPLTSIPQNDPEVSELLYGHTTDGGNDGDDAHYIMKDLSCRTSFLPATDHSKVLPSIVVSGLAEGGLDIMVDRTDVHYQEGWVLDVSKVERETKRKVERCGGLGYIDMKIALYGIPESGKLRFWLPFEGPYHDDHSHSDEHDIYAKHWFDDFVICEANEKRSEEACKLDQDMDIQVGGVPVTSIHSIQGAGAYLKRSTCVNVGVPQGAQISKLGNVQGTDGRPLSVDAKEKFGGNDESVGLVVDITAKAKVTRADGACCLSHIVWEMH